MTTLHTPPPPRSDWHYDAYFLEQLAKLKKKDTVQGSTTRSFDMGEKPNRLLTLRQRTVNP